jgi:hypothetical protein
MTDQLPDDRIAEWLLEDSAKRHQYQHEFSLAGFKTLILLNGGAIISLLTYIGNSDDKRMTDPLSSAFIWYVCGLVTVMLAYLAAYASQGAFLSATATEAFKRLKLPEGDESPQKHVTMGTLAIVAGVILCVVSLIAFVAGSWCAMGALK